MEEIRFTKTKTIAAYFISVKHGIDSHLINEPIFVSVVKKLKVLEGSTGLLLPAPAKHSLVRNLGARPQVHDQVQVQAHRLVEEIEPELKHKRTL